MLNDSGARRRGVADLWGVGVFGGILESVDGCCVLMERTGCPLVAVGSSKWR